MKVKNLLAILIVAGVVTFSLFLGNQSRIINVAEPSKPGPFVKPLATAPPKALAPKSTSFNNSDSSILAQPTIPSATNDADKTRLPTAVAPANQPLKINGYIVEDPTARAALSLVGSDPDATVYWAQAINDPTLPSEERKDLIEDLNEDGLTNPHQAAPEDLPIIAYRLQLIEWMSSSPMDRVNADAFAEAYKDLVNLYYGRPTEPAPQAANPALRR
jgi:hypothetical protein